MSDSNSNNLVGVVIGAVIGACAVIGAPYVTSRVEDRKADAEFAKIALSILSANIEAQNSAARVVAIDLLASTLPIDLDECTKKVWLGDGKVLLTSYDIHVESLIRNYWEMRRKDIDLDIITPASDRPLVPKENNYDESGTETQKELRESNAGDSLLNSLQAIEDCRLKSNLADGLR